MQQIGLVYARASKRLNLYKIVRRPPCWKSTARLARHARSSRLARLARLARQSRTCRVESSQVEFEPIRTDERKSNAGNQHGISALRQEQ